MRASNLEKRKFFLQVFKMVANFKMADFIEE
jgi:hypothetical protein